MVWTEEERWCYVWRKGYEVLDKIPFGWRVMETSLEPKPYGLVWIGRGSRFDGTYEKALYKWPERKEE